MDWITLVVVALVILFFVGVGILLRRIPRRGKRPVTPKSGRHRRMSMPMPRSLEDSPRRSGTTDAAENAKRPAGAGRFDGAARA